MTEKRFYLIKNFLRKDKFHDMICHRFMDSKETEKTLNRLYGKYSSLKKENERMKTAFKRKYDYDIAEIVDEVYDGDLEMTEKQFEIICEDYSLVDMPVYVISDDKLKFDIYGSKKDAERLCTLLNENGQLKKGIEIDNEVVKIIKKHLPIGFVGGLVDKQIENTVKSIVEELREEEGLKSKIVGGDVDD